MTFPCWGFFLLLVAAKKFVAQSIITMYGGLIIMVQGKAVLLSIRPEWCDLILRGKKTMEVRKNYPKHLYEKGKPFKVYIYCTKAPQQLITIFKDGEETMDGEIHHGKPVFVKFDKLLPDSVRGKTQMVVGEFVCDKIYEVAPLNHTPDDFEQQACMDRDRIWEYLHGQGWAWHISERCNPDTCPNCMYIGEGDSWCDKIGEIVLSDWEPTDYYMGCCKGARANESTHRA